MGRQGIALDLFDNGCSRPLLQPGREPLQVIPIAPGHDLDATIRKIPNPARKAVSAGLGTSGGPESNALDASAYKELLAC